MKQCSALLTLFSVIYLFSACMPMSREEISDPTSSHGAVRDYVAPNSLSSGENPTNSSAEQSSDLADDSEPPLSETDLEIAVPNFLDKQQQLLYQRAYSLYMHTFGGDTSMVEYPETFEPDAFPSEEYRTIAYNGMIYQVAQGRYKQWNDFDTAVHSVFTDRFWTSRNQDNVFIKQNGSLCYISAARGSGYYYNNYFPDEFRLIEKTDSAISFLLIGHYSPAWLQGNETPEERELRLQSGYDYTLEFPIKLILTNDGWRFDEFHSALADEKNLEES